MKEQKNLIVWQDKVKLEIEILILAANRRGQQSVKLSNLATMRWSCHEKIHEGQDNTDLIKTVWGTRHL